MGCVQDGVDVHQRDLRAEEPRGFELVLVRAPGIDGLEDRRMTGRDRRLTAKVFPADVDEIGVRGEGRGKRRSVHRVPGRLELPDNGLERGSIG